MSNTAFLGTTDEVTTCDCCGRANLKSTVAISIDGGEAVYFGITCAARALRLGVREIKAGTKAADDAKHRAEMARRDAEHAAFMARWQGFLNARVPGRAIIDQIAALGGPIAARAAFKVSEFAA